jgi:hypothetical protein
MEEVEARLTAAEALAARARERVVVVKCIM